MPHPPEVRFDPPEDKVGAIEAMWQALLYYRRKKLRRRRKAAKETEAGNP
ncbi:MAG: hypothetical protein LC676_05805 [Loktanella sp.]|nr:hypothetical protein [Loktanella sp.]